MLAVKQSLMCRSHWHLGDENSERNVINSGVLALEVSERNRGSIGNQAGGHSCDIVAKNLGSFWPFLRTYMGLDSKVTA